MLEPVIRAGETLAVPRDYGRDQALALWLAPERTIRVLVENETVLGIFYIRANQRGGGSHVANAGYVTATQARGRGIARHMCAASLDFARRQGYRTMHATFGARVADMESAHSVHRFPQLVGPRRWRRRGESNGRVHGAGLIQFSARG